MLLIRTLYLSTRQLARRSIINNPALDRWLGDPLRKIERALRPHKLLLQYRDSEEINIHNIRFRYRQSDMDLVHIIQLTGDYEPETTQYLLDHLKPGNVFVDLGAHIGYMTLVCAKVVGPTGKVYAFEPNPDTFQQLQSNIQLNGFSEYVTTVPKAIADRSQILRFYIARESSVTARIDNQQTISKDDLVEVEAVSLDEYFSGLDWPAVHFIKMDVEGAEVLALHGMRELSQRNPHLALIVEINYPLMQRMNLSGETFLHELQEIGFTRFRILKKGYDRPLTMPVDLDFLVSVASRFTVNILCEK